MADLPPPEKLGHGTLYLGDCLDVLKTLPDESVDAIVTDPPYQLSSMTKKRTDDIAVKGDDGKGNPYCYIQAKSGFMGKKWDVLPEVPVLRECLRVMKSGAFSFWLMTPRQDCHLEFLLRLRTAGFIISFSPIFWSYASGFPKAANIGRIVDKQLGAIRQGAIRQGAIRQGAISKGNTFPLESEYETGEPITPEAKALEGSYAGFQPKPAVEIIVVAMKPLNEKTYVAQALKNQKGITWLGDGRIPYQNGITEMGDYNRFKGYQNKNHIRANLVDEPEPDFEYRIDNGISKKGRFPANLLVSDDVLDDGKITTSSSSLISNKGTIFGGGNEDLRMAGHDDEGQFSRYFSLDAWWERQISQLPQDARQVFPFLIVPKAGRREREEDIKNGLETNEWGTYGNGIDNVPKNDNLRPTTTNPHPTVKPVKLMAYLITIASRPCNTILDPFIGSGTTAIAAELTGRDWIGIEREPEYHEITKGRLSQLKLQKRLFE